jgi:hypothetical protein|tara:strand:+ start:1248 stop:1616 length:369 start_codon:yes stop_codon:yes gene_type:complete
MQTVNKSANTIEEGFEFLKEAAIQDYKEFINNENMIKEYEDNIQLEVGGSKFFKITTGRSNQRSVFGFIVKEDMFTPGGQPQFKKGDILKAASWKAPAKNRARGNVLSGNYPIQWTGPLYLS